MFGLGIIEAGIIVVLGYLAFKHIIVKRYPGIYKTLNYVFFITIFLMLLFGILTHTR